RRQAIFKVQAEERSHAAQIAFLAGAPDHRPHALERLGMRRLELVAEPALRGRLDDALEAVLPYRVDEAEPEDGEVRHHLRAAAAGRQAGEAVGMLDGGGLRDRAAEAQAGE